VLAAGGTIRLGRVNGDLNVSRTLGDLMYKVKRQPISTWPISNVPDVTIISRETLELACGQHGHIFLVVATDGFWDVVSNEKAATLVAQHFTRLGLATDTSKRELEEILSSTAVALVKYAVVTRQSQDNTTVQVIVLRRLSKGEPMAGDAVAGEVVAVGDVDVGDGIDAAVGDAVSETDAIVPA
jgi:serine/threonine protein phosphatase PrpC